MELHDTVYDQKCNFRDAGINSELQRLKEADRMLKEAEFYVNSVKCVNADLQKLVTTIAASDPSAVIIVAADHGSSLPKQPGDPTSNSFVKQRSAIFSAWKLPGKCRHMVYNKMSPVNHFRILFNCLFDDGLEILPDKTYRNRNYTDFISKEVIPAYLLD